MSGFTSIELMLLLDSGAAYHSEQGLRVRLTDLSPTVKAVIKARLNATPCAECKQASTASAKNPCTHHASYSLKDVGTVAVHANFFGAKAPGLFVFHDRWELNALEELLLTEIKAMRPPTPEETQQMREDLAHWAVSAAVCAEATAYRLTIDLTALGTGRAFRVLHAMLYKPGADLWFFKVMDALSAPAAGGAAGGAAGCAAGGAAGGS